MGAIIQSLLTLVVISILILVHEWGHFIAARRLGIHVERFSIGFGKKLFSRVYHGTEYLLCAVPLGGYVKMAGDEREKCQGTEQEYYSHSIGHRAFIVLMGPLVNFVFAYLCFYYICVTGFPVLAPRVGQVEDKRPAQIAGLEADDYILAINGQKINSWKELQTMVRSSEGALQLSVLRKNQILSKKVVPEVSEIPDMFYKKETVRIIGIVPKGDFTLVRYGVFASFVKATQELVSIPILTFKVLYHIVSGDMPAKGAVGGPILIMVIIKQAFELGMAHVIYITAVISSSLAVINLFPLPVLDGGHLLFLGIEKIRRKPLPLKIEETMTKMGTAFLLLLMLFVVYNDISQLELIQKIQSFFTRVH